MVMKKIFICILVLCTASAMFTFISMADAKVVNSREDISTVEEAPYNENPLTGVADLSDEAIGKRPVAVMVNNHPDNYPQWNIRQADVIFEVVVEHTLTRFMCLYSDYTNLPYIVSPRSYRYYFGALAAGFDAFYIHFGEDSTMLWYLDELGLDTYDGITNSYLFGWDSSRLNAGYAQEHSSYFNGALFPSQIEADGLRTDLDEDHLDTAFKFVNYGTVVRPDGNPCMYVDIQFGEQTAQFVYDEENDVYLKEALNEAQIDGITGEQLSFTNVFVLYTKIYDREDEPEADRKWLDWEGGDDAVGYYISNGAIQKIHWSKESEQDRLRFYDTDGNELSINRGKTYIALTYDKSATYSKTYPEKYLTADVDQDSDSVTFD